MSFIGFQVVEQGEKLYLILELILLCFNHMKRKTEVKLIQLLLTTFSNV